MKKLQEKIDKKEAECDKLEGLLEEKVNCRSREHSGSVVECLT